MYLSVDEIIKATGGRLLCKGDAAAVEKIDTDSRLVGKDSLFIPLAGEKFDGHDFLDDVVQKGCRVLLTCRDEKYEGVTVISVKDTRLALSDIARYYIDKVNPKRVAVTGSVGKTTTKDMIGAVCDKIGSTLKTKGNFNNDIGVPLTAFNLTDEEIAIFEMGMNHFGEISYLSDIVKPQIAVITNIGHSHIENLGSREGILKAKLEILDGMSDDGILVLNGDDALLYEAGLKLKRKVIFYGIDNKKCDLLAYDIQTDGNTTVFSVNGEKYEINLPGKHNVYNALCAVAVGKLLGGDNKKIKDGLYEFKSEGIRQNILRKNGYTVIADCYNAAPDSMLASLDVLSKIEGKRKIAVFGSVMELGSARDELLYEVGTKIANYGVHKLITVSKDAAAINKGASDFGFSDEINLENNEETLKYLKDILCEGDVVLIKGSRKYRMEEISEGLIK